MNSMHSVQAPCGVASPRQPSTHRLRRKDACAIAVLGIGLVAAHGQAGAAEAIRIGVVTTLTTPSAAIGRENLDAINLALDHIGGEIAGHKVELLIEDDAANPETGRQKAEKLARLKDVDIIAGFNWTNVMMAARRPVLDGGKIMFGLNPGPSDLAGKLCSPNFFSTRAQTDVAPMVSGEMLNQMGVKKLFIMAPNYAAAKDVIAGVQKTFKGEIVGQALTKWGSDPQMDFSAEFANAKASGADSLYAFYPGGIGAAFARQFDQSGIGSAIRLYTIWTLDQLTLPALQAANVQSVLGSTSVEYWVQDLDTPENRRFVEDFKKKYGRLPSMWAAQAYDFIPAVKAAIEQASGAIHDIAKISAALRKADYKSLRGPYQVAANGMPINPYYVQKVVALPDGTWTMATERMVSKGIVDPHLQDCPLAR